MAFTPSQYLSNNSNVILKDQQHAARLFVDDNFRLAPKFKFLFHVAFKINQAALLNINLAQRHSTEINMLVKNCDLPQFQIKTETLNQYNRKKNVQYTHSYQPINIIFHDDNMGLINQLWHNYYNYYYADPSSAKDAGAYNKNATKNFSYVRNTYGLDNGSLLPFFQYIKLYQMARHEYVEYTLYNPIITSWNHNKVDYASSQTHDNSMTIAYEAVSYDAGSVTANTPIGFGREHYDTSPSPLKGQPITTSSPSFALANTGNAGSFLNNVATSINSYQNTSSLPISGIPGLSGGIVNTSSTGVAGLQGIYFPGVSQPITGQVLATPLKF